MPTCRHCSAPSVGTLNGDPLCNRHFLEAEAEFVLREERALEHEEEMLESQVATYAMLEQEAARYEELIPPARLLDTEFGPVLWLLSAPFVAGRAWRYLDIEHRMVDWDGLLELSRSWTKTERLFIELAYHLWSGSTTDGAGEPLDITPHGWRVQLDSWSFQRVLEALAMSGGKRVAVSDPEEP